jgi:flagellar protein FliO/FliZ
MPGVTRYLVFSLLFLDAVVAFGADTPASSVSAVPSPVSFGGMLQLLLGLVIVLGAIAAAAWFLRRFGQIQSGAASAMKVLGGVAVGPRERLVLVEIGETWVVVGVAPGRVNHVHTMERPANISTVSSEVTGQPNFSSWLKQAMKKDRPGG